MHKYELDRENLNVTVKHSGGTAMFLACISVAGVGKLELIKGTKKKMNF